MVKFGKFTSILLCAAVLIAYVPAPVFADDALKLTAPQTEEEATGGFTDMPQDWSTAALKAAVAGGLLKGYETKTGTEIRPKGSITRAEMVTVVNRAFGATEKAALDGVTDVKAGAWYADEIAKAVAMQTMTKVAKMRPNDPVTRQEAFTILARAYKVAGGSEADLAAFKDADSVASYAKDALGALVKNGYINGNGGLLNPKGYMTRAEFAKVLSSLTEVFVKEAGEYSKDAEGNVIVNTSGVTLKDMKIGGSLIIAEGVGEGDVTLENVTIGGDMIVKAGGDHSIHIKDIVVGGRLVVEKIVNAVRLVFEGKVNIPTVDIRSDAIVQGNNVAKDSNLGNIVIEGNNVRDIKLEGDFAKVENKTGKAIKINDKTVEPEKAAAEGGNDTTIPTQDTQKPAADNPAGASENAGGSSTGGSATGGHKKPGLTPEQKLEKEQTAADKALLESTGTAIRVEVAYLSTAADVKAALTEKVNALSGLNYTDWEISEMTGLVEQHAAEQTVSVVIKRGNVVTEAIDAKVIVAEITAAESLPLEKAELEAFTDIEVSVGFMATEESVKRAIFDNISETDFFALNLWEVDTLSGFERFTAGRQQVTFTMKTGNTTTAAIPAIVNVANATDEESLAVDKAGIEADAAKMTFTVGERIYTQNLEELIGELIRTKYPNWSVSGVSGFTAGHAGEQNVTVNLYGRKGNEESATSIVVKVTVTVLTVEEKLAADKERIETALGVDPFAIKNTDGIANLVVQIESRVADMGLWYPYDWKAATDDVSGFTAGVTGVQTVSVVLRIEKGTASASTNAITIEVKVTEPTAEEKAQEDIANIKERFDLGLLSAEVEFGASEDAVKSAFARCISFISGLNFTDWQVTALGEYDTTDEGESTIDNCTIASAAANKSATITLRIEVGAKPESVKMAEDKAKLEAAGASMTLADTEALENDATEADAKAALAVKANAVSGLNYDDWAAGTLAGFAAGTSGTQNVTITFTRGNVTTSPIAVTVTVKNASIEAKIAADAEKLGKNEYLGWGEYKYEMAESLAVTMDSADATEAQVMAAIQAKVNSLSSLQYHEWTVEAPGSDQNGSGYRQGRGGNQAVNVYFKAGTTSVHVYGIPVTLPELPDDAKLAYDKAALEGANWSRVEGAHNDEDGWKSALKNHMLDRVELFMGDQWQITSFIGYREPNVTDEHADSVSVKVKFTCNGTTTNEITVCFYFPNY